MDQTFEERLAREALEKATRAEARVEALEKHHGDRFVDIAKEMNHRFTASDKKVDSLGEDMKAAMKSIADKIDRFSGWRERLTQGSVLVLLSVVGYLLINGSPWN